MTPLLDFFKTAGCLYAAHFKAPKESKRIHSARPFLKDCLQDSHESTSQEAFQIGILSSQLVVRPVKICSLPLTSTLCAKTLSSEIYLVGLDTREITAGWIYRGPFLTSPRTSILVGTVGRYLHAHKMPPCSGYFRPIKCSSGYSIYRYLSS